MKISLEKANKILELYYDCFSTGRIAERTGLDRLDIMRFEREYMDEDMHMANIGLAEAQERIKDKFVD